MDDFRRKPVNRVTKNSQMNNPQPPVLLPESPADIPPTTDEVQTPPVADPNEAVVVPQEPKNPRKKFIIRTLVALLIAFLLIIGGLFIWFQAQLAPVDSGNKDKYAVTVVSGTTPKGIAQLLKENNLIQNENIFLWYTRLTGVQNNLQAGTYRLSPSESLPEIVTHLGKGTTDEFTITFLPGDTLNAHREILESVGYKTDEIDKAFSASYNHPLLITKPKSASLEGYIYGETYQIASGSTVEAILERTFDQFLSELEERQLIPALEAKGYTLHAAIILASIIQREEKDVENQRLVAGVFLNRLEIDMMLQSDPTFIYGARQIGAPETNAVDSPYNTYKYEGLPPGPIASPNVTALEAIVNPEPSENLYFLSGDDNKLYFARTFEEHEQNIRNHCQQKCFSY